MVVGVGGWGWREGGSVSGWVCPGAGVVWGSVSGVGVCSGNEVDRWRGRKKVFFDKNTTKTIYYKLIPPTCKRFELDY